MARWRSALTASAMATLLLGATLVLGALPGAAQEPPTRLRGTVEKADAQQVTIKTRKGDSVTVNLLPDTRISSIFPADLDSIKPGTFIGTAATGASGSPLKALEVVVFPENMRGTGEGHRPWDLTPDSNMTNGNVDAVVNAVDGRTLKVSYKGGEQTVLVPPDTPIVTFEAGDPSLVKPGVHVFAIARKQPDGSLGAGFIGVGKDGLVPPM